MASVFPIRLRSPRPFVPRTFSPNSLHLTLASPTTNLYVEHVIRTEIFGNVARLSLPGASQITVNEIGLLVIIMVSCWCVFLNYTKAAPFCENIDIKERSLSDRA
ncbi:hypothetical protein RB195_005224 [Necator americanus]|uniref:Uncharacterized protein n=1 Tax=Necator americanus TaxID=51031 RepID=A0ABR1BQP1_NECAM